MPELKICGITNLEDAEKSVSLGADYLGFIFAESQRQIALPDARQIKRKLKDQVRFVGVFKDQDPRFVNDTAEVLGLDFVQLHGSESAEYCLQMNRPVIKVVELDLLADIPDLSNYRAAVQAFLFDRPKSMSKTHDWIEQVASRYGDQLEPYQPFFIAGGLNSENLHHALSLNPFAIDLASGVESEIGKKDHQKLESFVIAMQGAKSC